MDFPATPIQTRMVVAVRELGGAESARLHNPYTLNLVTLGSLAHIYLAHSTTFISFLFTPTRTNSLVYLWFIRCTTRSMLSAVQNFSRNKSEIIHCN
jgi:hypothetical protein